MCHTDVPPGTPIPSVRTEEVMIAVGRGEAMPAMIAIPRRPPAPAVLVINGRNGRTPFSEHLTMRLADAGFLALCPEYFFRLGPLSAYSPEGDRPAGAVRVSKLDVAQWPVDLDRAADWLRAHSLGDGQLGTLGFCMGGSAALLMAARRTDAAASVSYYGFVRTPGRRAPSPIDHAHEMRGAILGHWGAADPAIPGQDVGDLDAALDRAGVEHEFHVYEGLGHNFLEPLLLAGDASGHEDACRSWTRTLTFFGERFDRRDPAPPLSR